MWKNQQISFCGFPNVKVKFVNLQNTIKLVSLGKLLYSHRRFRPRAGTVAPPMSSLLNCKTSDMPEILSCERILNATMCRTGFRLQFEIKFLLLPSSPETCLFTPQQDTQLKTRGQLPLSPYLTPHESGLAKGSPKPLEHFVDRGP